jgi:MFS family permease
MLANLASLPASGSLAALVGRRRAYQVGLAALALGSAVIPLGGSFGWLIIGRLLQGAGAGLMLPNAAGLLEANLTRTQRSRGVATWVSVSSLGIFVGPVAGGLAAQHLGWRWVFVAETVIAVAGLVLASRLRDDFRGGSSSVDLVGMLLGGGGVCLACLAVLEAGRAEPALLLIIGSGCSAPFLLAMFVRHERRVSTPALDMTVFSRPGYRGLVTAALVYNAGVSGFGYVVALSLQQDQGLAASTTGWLLFSSMSLLPLGSYAAGRLAARLGIGRVMTSAAAGQAAAFTLGGLALWVDIRLGLALFVAVGLAVGLLFASDTVATMELVPARGLPSGLANLSLARQVGSVVGVAVLGTLYQSTRRFVEPGAHALAVTLVCAGVAMLPACWLIWRRVSATLPARGADVAQALEGEGGRPPGS